MPPSSGASPKGRPSSTMTSLRSSTSCRNRSVNPRDPGSITALPLRTWSTRLCPQRLPVPQTSSSSQSGTWCQSPSAVPTSSRRYPPSGGPTACTPSRPPSAPSSLWHACKPILTGDAPGALGTTIEALATEVRLLQRTEVGEVEEPFATGQKGSSAMPHKRNPITAERLSGLARVLRGYLVAGLEDVALWHERDISHSSVERTVLPDASIVAHYATTKMTRLIDGLVIHADRMRENLLEGSYGLVFSQPVLLALIGSGLARDAAYRIVQRDARAAHEQRRSFRDILAEDPEVTEALGDTDEATRSLDEAFDLTRSLANIQRTFTAL